MSRTTSLAFPNMFDVSRNRVNVAEDNASVVNRVRLLLLTEPTEVFNSPTFGVGLKRYLWQYNTANTKAMIQERIKEQLELFEPCVDAAGTSFGDGLLFSEGADNPNPVQEYNTLKMTVGLQTIFGDTVEVKLNADGE